MNQVFKWCLLFRDLCTNTDNVFMIKFLFTTANFFLQLHNLNLCTTAH